jgi:hypothetical protein
VLLASASREVSAEHAQPDLSEQAAFTNVFLRFSGVSCRIRSIQGGLLACSIRLTWQHDTDNFQTSKHTNMQDILDIGVRADQKEERAHQREVLAEIWQASTRNFPTSTISTTTVALQVVRHPQQNRWGVGYQ